MKFFTSRKSPPFGAVFTADLLPSQNISYVWSEKTELKVTQDLTLSSSSAISRYLARLDANSPLYGSNVLQQTEIDHWISFAIGPLSCDKELQSSLTYLNNSLGSNTYFVGNNLTIADLNVFGQLIEHSTWSEELEKQGYTNISRWFRVVENFSAIKNSLEMMNSEGIVKGINSGRKAIKTADSKATDKSVRKEEGKFIELPGAEMGKVIVRFPPEASGYLHIGHAKAALLNWHYRELFKGQLIMRFDDTNPDKEKVDFEKVILEDLKLLEIYPDKFTHTSDHFPLLLDLCEGLLKSGDAYVDDTPAEQMKAEREARQESKNRGNSADKNMQLWAEMKKGTEVGQLCCVRAKIDMNVDNGCMRDPTIYRCKNEPHPRTKDKYKVYPTYDFACPVVDSIEGVTHALRTMEYHDRDEQYYWFCDKLRLRKPIIWEYSRLNMMNTVLSKRKLTWFVEEGLVDSWEDPRFPTVRGVIRRGMTVLGLKQFIIAQGSSRSVVQMEWDKIWAFNKKVIDPIAPRYTALLVEGLVPVNVRNASSGSLTVAKHPKNSEVGTKTIFIGPKVLIEVADANLLKEGENATFINWGNLKIVKLHRNNDGNVTEVEAELNLSDTDYKKTLKLTWLAKGQTPPTSIEVLYYDHIISKPVLGKDEDFKAFINKESKKVVKYIGDSELATLAAGEIIQLQRIGFFKVDKVATSNKPIVLIHIPDGSTKPPAASGKLASGKILTSEEIEGIADNWRSDRSKQIKSSSPDELSIRIQIQGDIVRQLKSTGAEKTATDDAVRTLLSLKSDFKAATGIDWKPNFKSESPAAPIDADNTSKKIAEKGDSIRKLKSSGADKKIIEGEVKLLLSLKQEYKTLTGKDWVPPKISTVSETASSDLCAKITAQGEKVRQLKAGKVDKTEIDEAIKCLLALKSEYKNSTGQEWKPKSSPSVQSSPDELSNRIKTQGNLVRQLKANKSPKTEVEEAVKALLTLKQEYKDATGQEWKPDAPVQTTPPTSQAGLLKDNKVPKGEVEKELFKNTIGKERSRDMAAAPSIDPSLELSGKIAQQGDKVRKLKSEKADKSALDEEVKTLLNLKAEYKSITGSEWRPPPTKQNIDDNNRTVEAVSSAIEQQGNKIRQLKAEKASADVIDKEVEDLMNLKAEYKTLSGVEWKPSGNIAPRKTQKDKSGGDKKSTQEKKDKEKKVDKEGSLEKEGLKKQTRLGLEARKEENLPDWYSQVITKGELIEYYDVSGCYILRPWAFAVWEAIQSFLDHEIKKLGVVNAYFPMFVSRSVLEREKAHIADFAPEVAWVTRSGDSELSEHIAIRPTSETAMYPAYSKWIQSHRDLPLRLNQWNNVVRWEFKHPQPFLRTREFLWQEGHTAFATYKEAEEEVYQILDLYARVYTDLLAVPVVKGRKTEKEKFAGGDYTTTVEAFISASGRGIQGATSHHLGHNFAKMFDIAVEDPETKEKMFVFQNSWGLTTRTIGVMIMVHADNQGLVMPPAVAALQVVIVPCGVTASLPEPAKINLINACKSLDAELREAGVRSKLDGRDNYSPGWKFNHWELKGVPVRVELGPKDLDKKQLVAVRRDNGTKTTLSLANAAVEIRRLLDSVQAGLYQAAEADLKAHTKLVMKWDDFCSQLDAKNILLAPFCEQIVCEENIKKDSARDQDLEPGAPAMGAKSLCIPLEQPSLIRPGDKCIHPSCSMPPKSYTLFGRSY